MTDMRRILLLAAIAAGPLAAAAEPRGLTAADLVTFARVSEPALSPDGRKLVYSLRETDLAADRGRSDLWLKDLDAGTPARRLTTHEENDTAAAWSPDGAGIYFLSS